MQPATGKARYWEDLRGQGWVVLVVTKKMADISLVSRVRTTAGARWTNS